MPTALFGPSLPVAIAAGGTRTILQGDPTPNGQIGDEYWSVFAVPTGVAPNIELLRTTVEEVGGVRRLRYTVRNNNPSESVQFRRFSIRVTP